MYIYLYAAAGGRAVGSRQKGGRAISDRKPMVNHPQAHPFKLPANIQTLPQTIPIETKAKPNKPNKQRTLQNDCSNPERICNYSKHYLCLSKMKHHVAVVPHKTTLLLLVASKQASERARERARSEQASKQSKAT